MPASDLERLNELFEQIRGCHPSVRRNIAESLYSQLHPDDEIVEEPAVKEARKGRPKRSRNLSAVEHARRKYLTSGSTPNSSRYAKSNPTTSTTVSFDAPGGSGPMETNYIEMHPDFRYGHLIPTPVVGFVDAYYDPEPDGHCGYRVISHALRGNENSYISIKGALLNEIRDQRYIYIFGAEEYASATTRISFMMETPRGPAHWMDVRDCFGFATMFNWTICVISSAFFQGRRTWMGCSTYLPLRVTPGVRRPYGILVILHTGNHYLRLHVDGEFPMPLVHPSWSRARDDTVEG